MNKDMLPFLYLIAVLALFLPAIWMAAYYGDPTRDQTAHRLLDPRPIAQWSVK